VCVVSTDRWYDKHEVSPKFAFGHGLSYSSFRYGSLTTKAVSPHSNGTVEFKLTNNGTRAASTVAQLYLSFPESYVMDKFEPLRVLRGFSKTELQAGASSLVSFALTQRDVSIWDVNTHAWKPVAGTFTVHVGESSRDFRQSAMLVAAF
jgi:beta-glucosidase